MSWWGKVKLPGRVSKWEYLEYFEDDPDYALTDEWMEKKAKERNCTVEYSDDYTLQMDLDSDRAYDTYVDQVELLDRLGFIELEYGEDIRKSRSGNHHAVLKLKKPLPVETRILLQALLGSDLKREMLSLAKVHKGNKHPVVLFRPK